MIQMSGTNQPTIIDLTEEELIDLTRLLEDSSSESDSDTEPVGSESDSDSETEPVGSESESDTDSDSESDSLSESESDPETDPVPEPLCPGCRYGSLGQRAHMEEPHGCLSESRNTSGASLSGSNKRPRLS